MIIMDLKKIFYNSVAISLPKNTVQFLIGVILYWFIFNIPNIFVCIFALFSFLLAYSSVYLYNDVVDYEEDLKDKEKAKWKFIAGGILNKKQAMILTYIFAFTGLFLSLFINKWFLVIIFLALFLNLIHSHPKIRIKRKPKLASLNMTIIQFLKYSSGWFALTEDLYNFPFWLILTFSLAYTFSYLIYKFKFNKEIIKQNKKLFISVGFGIFLSYLISFIEYGFPLALLILAVLPTFILLLFKELEIEFHRINNMMVLEYLLIPLIILSFGLLTIPPLKQLNENVMLALNHYKENLTEKIPTELKKPIENITENLKKYETLSDIERDIDLNLKNFTLFNLSYVISKN